MLCLRQLRVHWPAPAPRPVTSSPIKPQSTDVQNCSGGTRRITATGGPHVVCTGVCENGANRMLLQALVARPSLGNQAACYRIEKRGTPENSWEGAGKSAAKIRGAAGSAGEGAAPHSFPRKTPSQHPRQHSLQHPEFSQHSPQLFSSYFLGFPVSLFCSRLPGSQTSPSNTDFPPPKPPLFYVCLLLCWNQNFHGPEVVQIARAVS